MGIILEKPKREKISKSSHSNFEFDLSRLLSKDFKLSTKPGSKSKLGFYEQLDLLLSAGLDLESSLLLIRSQHDEKSQLFRLLDYLVDSIIGGKSLSEAMMQSGKFSEYEYYSIQIGEESGKLPIVIRNLKQFYSDVLEQRKKLISALSYPMVVLLVAVSAVYFLLQFVVPLFEDVFKRFDGELPYLTRLIITWSEVSGRLIPWVILLTSITGFIFYINRKKEMVRKYTSQLAIGLPVIGILIKKIYLARFFSALSLLVSSKNPLLHSMAMIRKMVRFYPLEKSLEKIESGILNGKSMFQCMDDDPLFDKQTVTLIRVAEEVGQLEAVLGSISESLSKDISSRMGNIGNLLEPILIIFVGGMVAVILVAMYLPLFNLSTSIY